MDILKSTTNTITLLVIMVTAIIALMALFLPVNPIPGEIWGAWGAIVGWVIGAKSQKSKYEEAKPLTTGTIEVPTEIKDILNQ